MFRSTPTSSRRSSPFPTLGFSSLRLVSVDSVPSALKSPRALASPCVVDQLSPVPTPIHSRCSLTEHIQSKKRASNLLPFQLFTNASFFNPFIFSILRIARGRFFAASSPVLVGHARTAATHFPSCDCAHFPSHRGCTPSLWPPFTSPDRLNPTTSHLLHSFAFAHTQQRPQLDSFHALTSRFSVYRQTGDPLSPLATFFHVTTWSSNCPTARCASRIE